MSDPKKDVTAQVQQLREQVAAESTELEAAVERHLVASRNACVAAGEVRREARRRSISGAMPKPAR